MNETLLRQYAEFAVRVGVNPQPGQTLIISAPVEGAAFARMCAEAAYDAGAREVVMKYSDERFARLRLERTDLATLEAVPPYEVRSYLDYAEREGGACILNILAEDPEIFRGIDAEKINRAFAARRKALAGWRELTMKDRVQWSIVAIPSPAWAKKVFPGEENAEEKLWKAIFDVCRVREGGDVVAAWREHVAKTAARRDQLNAWKLDRVRMRSANGTDLTVGLAEGAVWEGAKSLTPEGYEFIANIPTEEVFTAPDRLRVDGVVYATKPYVYNGDVIDGFWFRFENGLVTDFGAKQGEELLRKMLETDEGAKRIGELALVPASSPINRSGLLFYNTLFDENAACHIAFGDGYPGTVEGGTSLTPEELLARGVNNSIIHEDVMVGAADMTITGYPKEGGEVAIFENGEWAF